VGRFSKIGLSAALGAAAALVAISAETAQWAWDGVSRLVAIGDVHGAHAKLVSLPTAMDLVDADLAWSGGDHRLASRASWNVA